MTFALAPGASEAARTRIRALDSLRCHEATQRYKQHACTLLKANAQRVLDVGCGTGDDVLALAEAAPRDAEVVGVDLDVAMIEEAERRRRNVALPVHFEQADAHALPFPGESFDVVRSDRLLCEVSDAAEVLRELLRVLRPAGQLMLHEARAPYLLSLLEACGLERVHVVDEWPWVVTGAERGAPATGVTILAYKPSTAGERCDD